MTFTRTTTISTKRKKNKKELKANHAVDKNKQETEKEKKEAEKNWKKFHKIRGTNSDFEPLNNMIYLNIELQFKYGTIV